ncbi:MAG: 4-hydroxythreonine-4-phosphate dehydrogenase PdxA [Candidatus Cloacimonetes bacterium]|nr:4-hydroxythreonine-4-phosphate dehydrogenase PdxA [Candidatus Cloacimonadota bacterium]
MKIIAVTTGDPAGIGPEVVKKCFRQYQIKKSDAYIIYGDSFLPAGFTYIRSFKDLDGTARDRTKIMLIDNPGQVTEKHHLYAILIPASGVTLSKPDQKSGKSSYQILQRVVADIKKYKIDALVTGPVAKKSIQEFDPEFIGHTEFLAREFDCRNFVMNFVSSKFDVALLTTHVAIKDISGHIKEELIVPKMRLVYNFAQQRYPKEKVALLGLNPHCGEEGLFGQEEEVLHKAVNDLAKEGIIIDGPYPADSFFKYKLREYRQIIACYHDQGLIPFKMITGEEGVNVTLGLPFFRASVDHGTAYDIAGKGIASPKSLISALDLTNQILETL